MQMDQVATSKVFYGFLNTEIVMIRRGAGESEVSDHDKVMKEYKIRKEFNQICTWLPIHSHTRGFKRTLQMVIWDAWLQTLSHKDGDSNDYWNLHLNNMINHTNDENGQSGCFSILLNQE